MGELNWNTVFQALILAACTWYMRRGSAKDKDSVIRSTAAQSTSDEIRNDVKTLKMDMDLLKKVVLKDSSPDDRSPTRSQEND